MKNSLILKLIDDCLDEIEEACDKMLRVREIVKREMEKQNNVMKKRRKNENSNDA